MKPQLNKNDYFELSMVLQVEIQRVEKQVQEYEEEGKAVMAESTGQRLEHLESIRKKCLAKIS